MRSLYHEICYFYLKIHGNAFVGQALLGPLKEFTELPVPVAGLGVSTRGKGGDGKGDSGRCGE